MTDSPKPEPETFADLADQPTGSGVADEQRAFEQPDGADGGNNVVPTVGGPAEDESEGQPS